MHRKPHSVIAWCKRISSPTQRESSVSELNSSLLFRSFPTQEDAPTYILGCSQMGFTAFHLTRFHVSSSLWHFQGIHTISKDLGIFPAVKDFSLPNLMNSVSIQTPIISDWVSVDFPLCITAQRFSPVFTKYVRGC